MRALVIVLVFVGAQASAREKVYEPAAIRLCSGPASWDRVLRCFGKMGKPALVKSLPNARLVELVAADDPMALDNQLYLMTEQKPDEWRLAGMYDGRGNAWSMLDFAAVRAGKRAGHRIDIGQAIPIHVQLDGVTDTVALMRIERSIYCGGTSWYCPEAVTSCEVLVRGKAVWAFQGTQKLEENAVHVVGDRTKAGPMCAPAERVYLGW